MENIHKCDKEPVLNQILFKLEEIDKKIDQFNEVSILFREHIKDAGRDNDNLAHHIPPCKYMADHRQEHKEDKSNSLTTVGIVCSVLLGIAALIVGILV